mgnify:CR=1 FL=1
MMPCMQLSDIGEEPLTPRLVALANRVAINLPDHRNPEKFHAEKSEIVAELKRIAREADGG